MVKTHYDTGPEPVITVVECLGDLIVKGWPEPQVVALGERLQVEERDKGLTIRSSSRLTLRVPVGASLTLEQVRGDLIVKGVDADLHVNEVNGSVLVKSVANLDVQNAYGNLTVKNCHGTLRADTVMQAVSVRNVSDLVLGTVHGDLSGRYIDGAVTAEEIHGDLSLRTVSGDLTVQACAGDANLQNLGGRVRVERVAGDLRLTGGLAPGKHLARSDGEIILRWPVDAPLNLDAKGSRVRYELAFASVSEADNVLTAVLGDGETFLSLEAAGEILIRAHEEEDVTSAEIELDFGELGKTLSGLQETLTIHLDNQLAGVSARLAELGPEFSQKMARKAELAVERALKRVEKAQERSRQRYAPPPPPPSRPRKTSAEEQLKVLEMLEKGIISVEEATTLLEALES